MIRFSFSSRLKTLLESNPLLLRDLRLLKRRAWRTRFFGLVVLLGLAQAAAMLIIRLSPNDLKSSWGVASDEFSLMVLLSYFLGIHGILHGLLGFWAFSQARAVRSQLDELLVTPLSHKFIFGWLWLRSLILGVAILLAIYFPLYIEYDFLYESNLQGDGAQDPSSTISSAMEAPIYYPISTGISNLLILGLLALPWIQRRWLRFTIISFSIAAVIWTALTFYPFNWMEQVSQWLLPPAASYRNPDFGVITALTPIPTHANWHPLITVSYLFFTAAFYCGLGIRAGLSSPTKSTSRIVQIILLGPLIEFAFFHLAAWPDVSEAYSPLMALALMLDLYTSTAGALWLGLKWNLFIAMSRREILSYD